MHLYVFIIVACIAGVGEALRIKNVSKYSFTWHTLQFFAWFGIFLAGSMSKSPFQLLMFASVYWILYDGLINTIAFKKSFFYMSQTTKAFTEKFGYLKIPLLIISLYLYFYVENLLIGNWL